jgi:hypothetical protein
MIMRQYVLIYHGAVRPGGDEDMREMMAEWGAWFQQLGSALVDGGRPFGACRVVDESGVKNGVNGDQASGFSIIKAASLDDAANIAKGCPLVRLGSRVSVHETMDIPGM